MTEQTPEETIAHFESRPDPEYTSRSPPNEIIELDAHINPPDIDHPMYKPPGFDLATMTTLANASALGDGVTSARLESERRAMVEHENYVPRFTVATLTEIAVHLTVAYYKTWLGRSEIDARPFSEFSRLINESHDAPLSERYTGINDDRVVPRNGDIIDPYKALTHEQMLFFEHPDTGELARWDSIERASEIPDIKYRHQ